jgi:hypothetical protein
MPDKELTLEILRQTKKISASGLHSRACAFYIRLITPRPIIKTNNKG